MLLAPSPNKLNVPYVKKMNKAKEADKPDKKKQARRHRYTLTTDTV
jgi:hypothetical protein